jgi:hypothetical protein
MINTLIWITSIWLGFGIFVSIYGLFGYRYYIGYWKIQPIVIFIWPLRLISQRTYFKLLGK